jgi:hypothetical protein
MKKLLKLTLLLLASIVLAVPLRAANNPVTLVVLTRDNTQHMFVLADKPEVTFEGTDLVVTCVNSTTTFPLPDVIRFTYLNTTDAVEELKADETQVNFKDGMIVINQLKAGATVAVYSVDGRLVRQLTARESGSYSLNLSELPTGVYIVKADRVTYKIAKR